MAVVKFQSSEQTNFQNQLQNSNGGQISNPQIAKVNNLTPVQQTQPLNSTFKTDTTIGGNNFYIPNGGQGQQNALVNTGAVAGIKENNLGSLNIQGQQEQPQKKITGKAVDIAKKHNQNYCPVPNLDTPTTETTAPTPTPTPTKKTSTPLSQPTPQPQVEQPQEQEPVDEFAPDFYKQEQPQEEVQEEQPQEENTEKEATIDTENREGVIYGRASGDESTRIETNSDQYSATDTSVRERQNSLNSLLGMSAENIAISINSGYTPFGEQGMRDLQQYAPEKYSLIQQELKKLQTMENVNSIASGGSINITNQIQNTTDTINNSIDDRARRNSDPQSYDNTLSNLTEKLASSQTAQSATQEMLNINKDIAEIQAKMENLPNEAKKAFKGDVPDYIYQAYISNKQQEYQAQLNKLQSRYQSASDLYKTELANKQWEAEMEMKERQFQAQQQQIAFDQAFKLSQQNRENNFKTNQFNRQVGQQDRENNFKMGQYNLDLAQFQLSSIKTDSTGRPYQINQDGTFSYLQDITTQQIIQQQRQNAVDTLLSTKPDGSYGGQCETFTNRYLESVYGTRFQGVNGYTTAEEKAGYINTDEPVVGSIAIFNYDENSGVSEDAKKYGHTMVVTGYDPATGNISLKGSNKNGDEKVYSSTYNIKNLKTGSLKGFYDPMLDKSLDNQVVEGDNKTKPYGWNNMTDAFETKLADTKITADQRNTISMANAVYGTLQTLRDDGSLYDLIYSGDLGKVVAQLQQQNFGNDDNGSAFATELQKILGNSKLGLSEKSKIALNGFYTLIEQKLRYESGAAISSSEWLSNFQMMIPQSNESVELQMAKLKNRDKKLLQRSQKSGISYKDYVPLFEGSLPTGIEEQLDTIINDDRTSTSKARNFKDVKQRH